MNTDFDTWWENFNKDKFCDAIAMHAARNAWEHQQKTIDALMEVEKTARVVCEFPTEQGLDDLRMVLAGFWVKTRNL